MEELVGEVKRLIAELGLRVRAAVIVGSVARGDAQPWSDIDLLLISEDFEGLDAAERVKMVLEAWRGNRPIDPICLAPSEALEDKPLLWEFCRDGRVVVDDGFFESLKLKVQRLLEERGIKRFKYWYDVERHPASPR